MGTIPGLPKGEVSTKLVTLFGRQCSAGVAHQSTGPRKSEAAPQTRSHGLMGSCGHSLSSSMLAAVIKYYGLGSLNSRFISHSSGGWKPKTKGSADFASGEGCFLDFFFLPFCCNLIWMEGMRELSGFSFIRRSNLIYEGSGLMNESPPKGPTS